MRTKLRQKKKLKDQTNIT